MASLYERLGGREVLRRVVAHFYRAVADDPVLRPLYPEDLDGAEHRLGLFLVQFSGGPSDYAQERGHPRLRMRHFAFAIGERERDAWVEQMNAAIAAEVADTAAAAELLAALRNSADFLVNTGGLTLRGPGTAARPPQH